METPSTLANVGPELKEWYAYCSRLWRVEIERQWSISRHSENWTKAMSTSEDRWFEVWYSPGEDVLPTWLLIVTPDAANPGLVVVCDPLEGNRIVHQGDNYPNTCLWLGEDEYELVEGRVFPLRQSDRA